ALVLDVDAPGAGRRYGPGPAPAEQFEVVADRLVGSVSGDPVDPRQGIEEGSPLLRQGIGIVQVDLVQILDIPGIRTGKQRGPVKMLHDAVVHRHIPMSFELTLIALPSQEASTDAVIRSRF